MKSIPGVFHVQLRQFKGELRQRQLAHKSSYNNVNNYEKLLFLTKPNPLRTCHPELAGQPRCESASVGTAHQKMEPSEASSLSHLSFLMHGRAQLGNHA
jgi:hypothetical protein